MSDSERLTYTVEQAGKLLGLSKNVMYDAVADGSLPSIRIGRRILIPKIALEATLASAVGTKAA